ncbi:hypothetical protein C5167_026311 [Papaver somniferum]|nr:hypothetical protein C5167_026311 [Papaver somniferum]
MASRRAIVTEHEQIASHIVGWLNNFFKGSSHKISEGQYQGKHEEEQVWNEPSTNAEKIGLEYVDVEGLKKVNKNKKLVKKLAKKFHAFLASEAVIKQIPRLLGPGLNKAGMFFYQERLNHLHYNLSGTWIVLHYNLWNV